MLRPACNTDLGTLISLLCSCSMNGNTSPIAEWANDYLQSSGFHHKRSTEVHFVLPLATGSIKLYRCATVHDAIMSMQHPATYRDYDKVRMWLLTGRFNNVCEDLLEAICKSRPKNPNYAKTFRHFVTRESPAYRLLFEKCLGDAIKCLLNFSL